MTKNSEWTPMPIAPKTKTKSLEKALKIATIFYENELPDREYAIPDKEWLLSEESIGVLVSVRAIRLMEEEEIPFSFMLERNENIDRIGLKGDGELVTEWHGYDIIMETTDHGSKMFRVFGGQPHG